MSLGDAEHHARQLERHSDFGQLVSAYERTRPDLTSIADHPELFHAILHKAFEGRVRFEPYFGKYGILGTEALATFETPTQRLYTQRVADQSYGLGLAVEFDSATAANALKKAQALPTAINMSVESTLSPDFWDRRMQRYTPQDIICEILEHPVDLRANISQVRRKKDEGFTFALDDFDIGKDHEDRLKVFGPVIDIVKINGPFVRSCLEGTGERKMRNLLTLMNQVREGLARYNTDVIVLAEHVDNFGEAQKLYDLGIDAVQGQNLKISDYKAQIIPRYSGSNDPDINLNHVLA